MSIKRVLIMFGPLLTLFIALKSFIDRINLADNVYKLTLNMAPSPVRDALLLITLSIALFAFFSFKIAMEKID